MKKKLVFVLIILIHVLINNNSHAARIYNDMDEVIQLKRREKTIYKDGTTLESRSHTVEINPGKLSNNFDYSYGLYNVHEKKYNLKHLHTEFVLLIGKDACFYANREDLKFIKLPIKLITIELNGADIIDKQHLDYLSKETTIAIASKSSIEKGIFEIIDECDLKEFIERKSKTKESNAEDSKKE